MKAANLAVSLAFANAAFADDAHYPAKVQETMAAPPGEAAANADEMK